MYSFGYGLSYTSFEYSNFSMNKNEIGMDGEVNISFDLKNSGELEGEEIVQLYIRDKISSATRPIKELKEFKKIGLKPGETKNIDFRLSTEDLKFYDWKMDYVIEPGEFEIMVGASSEDIRLTGSITVDTKNHGKNSD